MSARRQGMILFAVGVLIVAVPILSSLLTAPVAPPEPDCAGSYQAAPSSCEVSDTRMTNLELQVADLKDQLDMLRRLK